MYIFFMEQEDITIITRITQLLETIDTEYRNTDYKQILQLSYNYLKTYCEHSFIDDYIDIDVECGKNITYCEKCLITKT
jgi:hypothetical protein